MDTTDLRQKTEALLAAGKKITFRWDCGNDEALIYTAIDGKQIGYKDETYGDLDMEYGDYLHEYLDLPSAGEFSLEGLASIEKRDDGIYIVFVNVTKGYADESGEWQEVNEEERDEVKLFG
jgi:hypothetical protein